MDTTPASSVKDRILQTGPFEGIVQSTADYTPMKRDEQGVCLQLATCKVTLKVGETVYTEMVAITDDSTPEAGQVWRLTLGNQNNPADYPRLQRIA